MEAQACWSTEHPDDVYPDAWGNSDGNQSGNSVRCLIPTPNHFNRVVLAEY